MAKSMQTPDHHALMDIPKTTGITMKLDLIFVASTLLKRLSTRLFTLWKCVPIHQKEYL